MAEQPALNRFYVASYAANDRDFPIVAVRLDPRVAGYRVPEDLSPHPDSKRYPNHVFTGSQPSNGDERVTHIYEILPSPWVPFTRYDDDLGPIQGRRRSVKNEGQVASLAADKRITYEAREGSAIVYTEIEETWSIETDEDGNSLFPIRDRDFYDASRGPVQERRQLFVPTGEEAGSLENVNGVITQTSYEPYNEFLSVKIVQTYSVSGPQLIGKATDNDGQLVTVTTQRKAALDYIPPNPTATRTVEVSREDAESLVERIVDTPEIFTAKTFSVERPDPIPQKFRVAVPLQSNQEVVEGDAELPTLLTGEISRSEEQRNKFLKRTTATSRDQTVLPQTLIQKATDNARQEVTVTETLQFGNTDESPTATKTVESEALGDGNYVITKTEVPEVFPEQLYRKTREDLTPPKFRAAQEDATTEQTIEGQADPNIVLGTGEFSKSEQQVNKFVKRVSTTSRNVIEEAILIESVLTPEGKVATRRLTLSNGAQSFTANATLIDANVEALGDGRTVKTEVTIPEIFTAKLFSVERPESIPQKFRALVPSKTDQFNEIGQVNTSISLNEGEVSKSEQQQTEFIKRVSVTARDQTVLPQSLVQKATTEDRQQAIVTETLQSGDTNELPNATRTIQSEAIGDGNYIITKTEVPEVFSAKTFSKERPDPVPQKFRVVVPSLTEQETLAGDAIEPDLVDGEIAKSEQQINKFVKRISKTTRDETQLPKSLTQKSTTNEGLLASVSETLQSGDTNIAPSATRSVQSEALGDGSYVVTVTNLPKVFSGETYSVERPDPLPQKFRVAARTLTSQQTIEGIADPNVDLSSGQLSKSEQQVTEFVKRTSVTSRDQTQLPATLVQRATDNDRQNVTVTETLQNTNSVELNSATVTIQSEALGDGNYLVTKTEVPEVFSAETYRKTKEDLTPAKFRAAQEDTTFEQTLAGSADPNITLAEGEFAKSEQQINKFVKRVSTTSRVTASIETLFEKVLTPQGQIGNRVLTLATGEQSFTPSATLIDANVEALGDGRTVKTEITVPSVFKDRTVRKTKPDLTPEKFRAAQEEVVIEENLAGTIGSPESINLGSGEFSKSEQQVTEFVKRVSTTSRDISASTDLVETIITPQGQIATRTLRLSSVPQSIQPDSLLIDGSIEALGDQRTIKTEVRVESLFDGKQELKRQSVQIPAKFIKEEVEEEAIIDGTSASPESIDSDGFGIVRSTSQRLTEFTVRNSQTTRVPVDDPKIIGGKVFTTELNGGIADVVEELSSNSELTETGFGIISSEVENLGGNQFLKRAVKLPELSELSGTIYDEVYNVQVPYTREIVESESELNFSESSETTPRDPFHSVKTTYNIGDTKDALLGKHVTAGEIVNISMPDRLVSVKLEQNFSIDDSQTSQTTSGSTVDITFELDLNYSVQPLIDIKNGYSGPADAVRHYFFLEEDDCGIDKILAKTSAQPWPIFKLQENELLINIKKYKTRAKIQRSLPNNLVESKEQKNDVTQVKIQIPPTINDEISVGGITTPLLRSRTFTYNYIDNSGTSQSISLTSYAGVALEIKNSKSQEEELTPATFATSTEVPSLQLTTTIPATTLTEIPSSNCLYDCSVTPYRYGLMRVEAVTVDLTNYK